MNHDFSLRPRNPRSRHRLPRPRAKARMNGVSALPPPDLFESLEAPQHLEPIVELADLLDASRAQIERLVASVMSYLNLSIRRAVRRRKHALRFNRVEWV